MSDDIPLRRFRGRCESYDSKQHADSMLAEQKPKLHRDEACDKVRFRTEHSSGSGTFERAVMQEKTARSFEECSNGDQSKLSLTAEKTPPKPPHDIPCLILLQNSFALEGGTVILRLLRNQLHTSLQISYISRPNIRLTLVKGMAGPTAADDLSMDIDFPLNSPPMEPGKEQKEGWTVKSIDAFLMTDDDNRHSWELRGLQTFEDLPRACLTANEADLMTDPNAPYVALRFTAAPGSTSVYDKSFTDNFKAGLPQTDVEMVDTLLVLSRGKTSVCAYFKTPVDDVEVPNSEKGRYWVNTLYSLLSRSAALVARSVRDFM